MTRFTTIGVGSLVLLSAAFAHAQEALVCEASSDLDIATGLLSGGSVDSGVVTFEAGSIEASLGDKPTASMSGGIVVRRGDRLAGADSAEYDPDALALSLTGNVRYEDPETEVVSDSAEFSYDTGQIRFDAARFHLDSNNSRGSADVLNLSREGTMQLVGVNYTTCPPGSNDWLLEADDISLDTGAGKGTAKGVKLRFKGVPILWAPRLSFPLGDARKSGVLTPRIGSAGRSGNEISVPYYWNIRENIDATFAPRWLSNRGLQIGSEFRYLTAGNNGSVIYELLNDDKLLNKRRQMLSVDHRTLFDSGWRNLIHFRQVSDSQYFEDLGGSLSLTSITHLDRRLQFDYLTDHWMLFAQAQDYQTLDESLTAVERPYRRLPQIRVTGEYPNQLLGLAFGLDTELVNFDRDVGATGWRFDTLGSVALPVEKSGWFVKPQVAYEYTRYDLSNTLPGAATDPTRSIPISSFDTGMILERQMKRSEQLVQTLEPRLLYVYIPYRDQDNLPVFDTITPNLNFVQLYRNNRFMGVDRVGDTNQLSFGLTSRVLNANSGEELVSATIGQIRYFSDRLVNLPDQPMTAEQTSDFIAEVRFLLYDNLNFDIGHQWSSDGGETIRSEARLQYRPKNNSIVNLAYRYRRGSLEQGDVSLSWPIGKSWNVVGRYNYSFKDKEPLEQFVGLEYESCCWGFRMVHRRYLSTRNGTHDTSIGLQVVLKGMTSLGTAADKMLERGILGYSAGLH